MRRALATLMVLASFALFAVPTGVGAGEATGIKGVVLDATCYGPCRYPPERLPPYTGAGLTVTVRSLPDYQLVAKLHPKDGHFAVKVPPGAYRVRAGVDGQSSCWRGEVKTVRVSPGEVARVRLHVTNECIV